MNGDARYRRQTVLPEIGEAGQRRLADAHVVIVGLGALGSVNADLLARAGIGHLRLVDRDIVEETNLQRQTLYTEDDVDRPKVEAAASRLRAVNGDIRIEGLAKDVHAATVADVLRGSGLIIDGTDNLETRYLLNEAALDAHIPFVYGGAVGTSGMVFALRPPETACFRCLASRPPPPGTLPTCETAGILNATSAMVASIQTAEALRLLMGQPPSGELLVVDLWRPDLQRIRVAPRAGCPACVGGEREFLRPKRAQVLVSLCGRDTVSLDPLRVDSVDLDDLGHRLERIGSVHRAGSLLVADVDGHHLTVFPDGRALIRGVADEASARSAYAKYVGS